MHKFQLIYQVEHHPVYLQPLFFLGLICFILITLFRRKYKFLDFIRFLVNGSQAKEGLIKAIIPVLLGVTVFLVVLTSMLKDYFHNIAMIDNRLYRSVQGRVVNYHPMPSNGHDVEKFDVNGVHFEFADDDLTNGGYNNAASRGGAIRANLYVRIGYYDKGNVNVILKLETESIK